MIADVPNSSSGAVEEIPEAADEKQTESDISPDYSADFLDVVGNGLLKKKVLKQGLGETSRPNHGDNVVISYKGFLGNGTLVDEAEHKKIVLGEGECIHAFDLSIPMAELKEEFEITTDPKFAYGELGREPDIPGNATLTYRITLEECGDPPNYGKMPIEQRFLIADSKRERGNFFFGRNEFHYSLTCYTKALDILTKAPHSNVKPSDSDSFPPCTKEQIWDLELKLRNNIAATQLKLEAFPAVVKTCDIVLQMDANNFKALFRKGKALSLMSEWPEAIAVFQRALEVVPSSARTKAELTHARESWRKERERQKRAFSKYFSTQKDVNKYKPNSFFALCFRYRVALSAVVVAGIGVTIGSVILRYST